jgi:putative Holliday junction resolvase
MIPDGPALPRAGRLLGLDWGEIRLGLAITDDTQIIASPLATLTRRRGKRFPMPAFLQLVADEGPVGIVVGLPLESSGEEGPTAAAARELAGLVGQRTALPVAMWDERMSSARALEAIREQDGSTRGRKEDVDSLAAAIFLQHFLESRRAVP